MKPQVIDVPEDDLAAEEENKLINEVRLDPLPVEPALTRGVVQEYKTW